MEIISHKGNMYYLVWENSILAPGRQGSWLKINRGLGGGVRCGGANPEDGGPTPLGTTRREKGVNSAVNQTKC